MAKKKHKEEHENLERWLVSYADFITLLFATFVVLYALSQIDLAKFKLLKISISQAFSPTIFRDKGGSQAILPDQGEKILNESKQGDNVNIMPPINPNLEVKQMEKAKEAVEKEIKKANIKGVSVKVDKRGLVISLVDSVFFDSGSAAIKKEAVKALDKVALTIKKEFISNKIRVEGHTDTDPINTAMFPSNWELSAARASSVVRHLISRFKMTKETFSAVGYADSIPLVPNTTFESKQKNRRVEIVILNTKSSELEATTPQESDTGESPETSDTNKEPAEDITIIKGGRTGSDLQEIEPSKSQSPTASEPASTGPIEMPIQKSKPNLPEVLNVETKTFD